MLPVAVIDSDLYAMQFDLFRPTKLCDCQERVACASRSEETHAGEQLDFASVDKLGPVKRP
jgi:hypothetical protein